MGTIATGTGSIMAGGGTFDVTFTGVGGHGGQGAHLTPDLMVAQATYVMAPQTIVSRDVPALETAVVSEQTSVPCPRAERWSSAERRRSPARRSRHGLAWSSIPRSSTAPPDR